MSEKCGECGGSGLAWEHDEGGGHPVHCPRGCQTVRGERPMTLTDFLLARIAEDEEVATQPYSSTFATLAGEPLEARAWATSTRALAECEAKRRIVSIEVERYGEDQPATDVLLALALPYADHPDYREEWKP